MLFQNPLGGAARRLLQSQNGNPSLRLARNAFKQSGNTTFHREPRVWWACVHAVRLGLLRGQTLSETVDTIFNLLKRQFHVYASQKARRMEGVFAFYASIYAENTLQTLAGNFSRRFLRAGKRPFYFLFGGACFVWDKERITDQELESCADDFEFVAELEQLEEDAGLAVASNRSWDAVFNKNYLKVWRRPVDNSYLFEYKAFGSFKDISAKSFFRVQMDLEYRKVWDSYVMKLDVVDIDEDTGSEVIHWITHYPYKYCHLIKQTILKFPMYSRDYVFARRSKIDRLNNMMMIISRSVEHPLIPARRDHVRVSSYVSQMVIRPHRSFEENGFDFILTYLDDPQTVLPTTCINWAARSGMPEFVEKLHQAALSLDSYSGSVAPITDLSSSNTQTFAQTGQYS